MPQKHSRVVKNFYFLFPVFIIAVIVVVSLLYTFIQSFQQQPVTTCQDYCQDKPHVMCVGDWEISGVYPDCTCTWNCEPQQTCDEYCQTQPHAQCVGSWNITGVYPDCSCGWDCEVSEPEKIELTAKPGDDLCDYHEATMRVGDEITVYVNDNEHTVKVTKISSQDMVTVIVDGFFTYTFAQLDKYTKLNNVGLYVKEVTYSTENSARMYIGENKVNSPNDCYGVE